MSQQNMILKATQINTLLGPIIVIADDTKLYLLAFVTKQKIEKEVARLEHEKRYKKPQSFHQPIDLKCCSLE